MSRTREIKSIRQKDEISKGVNIRCGELVLECNLKAWKIRFICTCCNKEYKRICSFIKHVLRVHSYTTEEQLNSILREQQEDFLTELSFSCDKMDVDIEELKVNGGLLDKSSKVNNTGKFEELFISSNTCGLTESPAHITPINFVDELKEQIDQICTADAEMENPFKNFSKTIAVKKKSIGSASTNNVKNNINENKLHKRLRSKRIAPTDMSTTQGINSNKYLSKNTFNPETLEESDTDDEKMIERKGKTKSFLKSNENTMKRRRRRNFLELLGISDGNNSNINSQNNNFSTNIIDLPTKSELNTAKTCSIRENTNDLAGTSRKKSLEGYQNIKSIVQEDCKHAKNDHFTDMRDKSFENKVFKCEKNIFKEPAVTKMSPDVKHADIYKTLATNFPTTSFNNNVSGRTFTYPKDMNGINKFQAIKKVDNMGIEEENFKKVMLEALEEICEESVISKTFSNTNLTLAENYNNIVNELPNTTRSTIEGLKTMDNHVMGNIKDIKNCDIEKGSQILKHKKIISQESFPPKKSIELNHTFQKSDTGIVQKLQFEEVSKSPNTQIFEKIVNTFDAVLQEDGGFLDEIQLNTNEFKETQILDVNLNTPNNLQNSIDNMREESVRNCMPSIQNEMQFEVIEETFLAKENTDLNVEFSFEYNLIEELIERSLTDEDEEIDTTNAIVIDKDEFKQKMVNYNGNGILNVINQNEISNEVSVVGDSKIVSINSLSSTVLQNANNAIGVPSTIEQQINNLMVLDNISNSVNKTLDDKTETKDEIFDDESLLNALIGYESDLNQVDAYDTFSMEENRSDERGESSQDTILTKSAINETNEAEISDKPVFKCDACGKVLKSRFDLSRHFAQKHMTTKPLLCEFCGADFANSGSFAVHRRRHFLKKPHECSECMKAFVTYADLKTHLGTHTKERIFQCKLCEKNYTNRHSLYRHVKTHSEKKDHVCDICAKRFAIPCLLKYHRKSHGVKYKIKRKS